MKVPYLKLFSTTDTINPIFTVTGSDTEMLHGFKDAGDYYIEVGYEISQSQIEEKSTITTKQTNVNTSYYNFFYNGSYSNSYSTSTTVSDTPIRTSPFGASDSTGVLGGQTYKLNIALQEHATNENAFDLTGMTLRITEGTGIGETASIVEF